MCPFVVYFTICSDMIPEVIKVLLRQLGGKKRERDNLGFLGLLHTLVPFAILLVCPQKLPKCSIIYLIGLAT